jgi:hypothetical protein
MALTFEPLTDDLVIPTSSDDSYKAMFYIGDTLYTWRIMERRRNGWVATIHGPTARPSSLIGPISIRRVSDDLEIAICRGAILLSPTDTLTINFPGTAT